MEPSEFVLHVDKLITVTSLQLHMVLQSFSDVHGFCDVFTVFWLLKYVRNSTKLHLTCNNLLLQVTELKYDDNVNFLRQGTFAGCEYDVPLVAAGSVFSHNSIDSLMVSSIFSANMTKFWEKLLDVEDVLVTMRKFHDQSQTFDLTYQKGSKEHAPLDILQLPTEYQGTKFKVLFINMLLRPETVFFGVDSSSLIVLGIYRSKSHVYKEIGGASCDSYVIVAPDQEEILLLDDRIYVLRG